MTDEAKGDKVVAAWSAADEALARLSGDRRLLVETAAIRSLIVDLLLGPGPGDELFDAAAVLGRLIAEHRGSPTLAALTLDHVADALGLRDAPWLAAARAALAEGYVAARLESARTEAREGWDYPRCRVRLGPEAVAIAVGYPSDDEELLIAWAHRTAMAAALDGARRVALGGSPIARRALADALTLLGVETEHVDGPDPQRR